LRRDSKVFTLTLPSELSRRFCAIVGPAVAIQKFRLELLKGFEKVITQQLALKAFGEAIPVPSRNDAGFEQFASLVGAPALAEKLAARHSGQMIFLARSIRTCKRLIVELDARGTLSRAQIARKVKCRREYVDQVLRENRLINAPRGAEASVLAQRV